MKKYLIFSLLLSLIFPACSRMRSPEVCLPDEFCEKDAIVNPCLDDSTLSHWWENFHDSLLNELISTALIYNQDLNIAREKICESRAVSGVNFSLLLPQIDAGTSVTRTRNSLTLTDSPFLGGKFLDIYQIGFDASWEVDIFGKNYDAFLGSVFDSDAAFATAYDIHVTLTSEVGRSYVVIRSLQEQIGVLKDYVTALDEVAHLSSVRFTGGLDAKQPYLDALSLRDQKKGELQQAEELYKQALYQLGLLEGRAPEELACNFNDFQPIPDAVLMVPDIFPSELICRRFDVRAAQFSLYASQARVSASRKELFPTISLTGLYGQTTSFLSRLFQERSKYWAINGNASQPLFHGGGILSNIEAVTSQQRQAAYSFEKALLTALTDVESAFIAVKQESERVKTYQEAVRANREKTVLERIRYRGGLIDLSTYLVAEELLFDYRINEIKSRENLMVALITLYKAMGGGWECF